MDGPPRNACEPLYTHHRIDKSCDRAVGPFRRFQCGGPGYASGSHVVGVHPSRDMEDTVTYIYPLGSVRPEFTRTVVTGGSGYLGAHLCEVLLRAGTRVVCLDNILTGAAETIAWLAQRLAPAGAA